MPRVTFADAGKSGEFPAGKTLLSVAGELGACGVRLVEHGSYVGRSDDISALQFTPNVSLIGYPAAYAHFDKTPFSHVSDLVHLTKALVLLALVAQGSDWQARYL